MNPPSPFRSTSTHEEIAARARQIWYARNCPIGMDEEIWFEAERQLEAERPLRVPPSAQRPKTKGVDIDEEALADRLKDFGDPGSRSSTSVDPTKLT